MERYKHFLAGFLLLSMGLVSGCTKTTEVTMVAPVSTGTIEGILSLREMDGTPSATSAGAKVTIIGTNYSAVTDSAGNYALDGIPAGYYYFRFSKQGFGEYIFGSAFVGAGTLHISIREIFRINNWKTTLLQPDSIIVRIVNRDSFFSPEYLNDTSAAIVIDSSGLNPSSTNNSLAIFIGTSPNINYLDTSTYFEETATNFFEYGNDWITIKNVPAHVNTIYMLAYPVSGESIGFSYYLSDTLKTEFSGFGPPSNTIKIVLP